MKPSRRKRKLARFKAKMRKQARQRVFCSRLNKPKYLKLIAECMGEAYLEARDLRIFKAMALPISRSPIDYRQSLAELNAELGVKEPK
jgi:hypothetical protein